MAVKWSLTWYGDAVAARLNERLHAGVEAAALAVLQYARQSVSRLLELTAVLEERQARQSRYEARRRLAPVFRARLQEQRAAVEETMDRLRRESMAAFADWYDRHITVEAIEEIIRVRRYTRKDAQAFLAGNVNDKIYGYIQDRLRADAEELTDRVTAYLDIFQEGARKLVSVDMPAASAPLDVRGAFAAGLASASVLGGLALWAGSMGNLGGYILVAKGVSLLSALGISLSGGTAAAVSAVAALAACASNIRQGK